MQTLIGCDFSSSPNRQKNIVIASGSLLGGRLQLSKIERLTSLSAFSQWLSNHAGWVGGFDLPFGLPRELVQTLGWPTVWEACIRHFATLDRATIRAQFAAFCKDRPVGGKFAHRATDIPAQSSPSMKWVNPPVAYMLHAGVPRLLDAGVYFPVLQPAPSSLQFTGTGAARVALEAYPGMLAREVLARRSYKSDDLAKQTPDRLIARKDLVHALEMGQTRLGLRVKLTHSQRDAMVADASGDALDALLCMVQAAWGWCQFQNGDQNFGLSPTTDPLEGWIVSA
jgi:hypothetical protein